MNWKIITAIAKKDWKEVRQNPSAWGPMLVIPLIFVVIFPLAIILIPSNVPGAADQMVKDPDMAGFFQRMPAQMSAAVAGLDELQAMIVLMLGYLFAPFFLIIPLMFTTVIASESFAGEYERKTLEALLYTAATDTELFLGKVMAAIVPCHRDHAAQLWAVLRGGQSGLLRADRADLVPAQ
jgi:ABC-2 type transport system permease protein